MMSTDAARLRVLAGSGSETDAEEGGLGTRAGGMGAAARAAGRARRGGGVAGALWWSGAGAALVGAGLGLCLGAVEGGHARARLGLVRFGVRGLGVR